MSKIIKNKIADNFDIEANIKECDISYRGGVLKVDVSSLFPQVGNTDYEESEQIDGEAIMGASQNYLGGGIAGSISGGAMFTPDELTAKEQKVFHALMERIKRYFYDLNNGGGDEYMQENVTGAGAKDGYDRLQAMPKSGY